VGFDQTADWNLAPEDKPWIKEIRAVYLFDRNTVTYCCEVTPSYYMRFCYHAFVFIDGTPDEVCSRIQEQYGTEPQDDCYMHHAGVDRFIDDHPEWVHHTSPELPESLSETGEAFDDLYEWCCCNPPL
jgi:hypothetical protein